MTQDHQNRSSWSAVRWLLARYARPYAGAIGGLALFTVVASLLAVLQPAILAALLANLSDPGLRAPNGTSWLNLNFLGQRLTHWLWGADVRQGQALLFFGILFVIQAVLLAGVTYLIDYGGSWLRAKLSRTIQIDLLEHLLGQDMAFFSRERTGELISRVLVDVNNTAQAIGPLVRSVIQNAFQIVLYSAYLFSTSVWLTLGSIILLGLQFSVTQVLKKPTRKVGRLETDAAARVSVSLQETFSGIRVAKSFGAEPFELEKLTSALSAMEESSLRRSRIEKLEPPTRSILDSMAVLGIFLIAVMQVRSGTLTVQGLILFTYVGKLLITPINNMATTALWIDVVGAAFSRVDELLAHESHVKDGSKVKTSFDRVIELRDVSFSYGSVQVIKNISFQIGKGEFIALVAPSGAGKSTLADLILRLYDPDSGGIFIDGVDLRTLRQREYRHMFGVVSQENLLFHDSVCNNIRYGRDGVTDEDVVRAAQIANAHDFISALPQGYNTIVGDRGIRLSGGERQRVAIARAVVHKPAILILDEATSSLDSESERLVQQAIDQVATSATAIVIAHRLSTVMHADRIVVLNEGRIEAIGCHEALLTSSPTYELFCTLQFHGRAFSQATVDAHS